MTGAGLCRAGLLPGLPGGARLWDQLPGFQRGTSVAAAEPRAFPAAGSHHRREQPPLCCRRLVCRSGGFQCLGLPSEFFIYLCKASLSAFLVKSPLFIIINHNVDQAGSHSHTGQGFSFNTDVTHGFQRFSGKKPSDER